MCFCCYWNRSALLRELLSNNSPFVGQLYEDKPLMPTVWFDLLYNWPPNSELLHNNSLLELIYFLNKEAGWRLQIFKFPYKVMKN